MKPAKIRPRALHMRTLVALALPLFAAAGGAAAQEGARDTPDAGMPEHRGGAIARVYSIINLAPDNLGAYLNERGEAAFSSFIFDANQFFDGERSYYLGSLSSAMLIRGLNNRGVVAGIAEDDAEPISNVRGFRWSRGAGLRLLPGFGEANGLNDLNQVVGRVLETGTTGRAVRWNADGSILPLGPRPPEQSMGKAINERSMVGGFADVPGGAVHAVLWDRAGRQTRIGTLGGEYASADLVNERGEAAGQAFDAANRGLGFFWSPRSGMVPLIPQRPGWLYVTDLNDRGNMAGIVQGRDAPSADQVAYRWTQARGIEWLAPSGPGITTDVTDLNNRNQMVGSSGVPGRGERALRWDWSAAPVDLNRQLYRPPAGLVLYSGRAINDAGTILAYSSAGLLMLRPGTRGTDAPVLGPIRLLPDRALVGQEARGSVGFVDNSPTQTHRAAVTWEDGCTSPYPLVREARGVGQVSFQHRFCRAGLFRVTLRVTDSGGRTTSVARQYIVDEPGTPSVSAQGALAASTRAAGAVHFALWTPFGEDSASGAGRVGRGRASFQMAGPFQFQSDQVEQAARDGDLVRVQGSGRFNGRSGYRFVLEAQHGAEGEARMRVRLSHAGAGSGEVVVYDNAAAQGPAAATAASATAPDRPRLRQGAITIHQ